MNQATNVIATIFLKLIFTALSSCQGRALNYPPGIDVMPFGTK